MKKWLNQRDRSSGFTLVELLVVLVVVGLLIGLVLPSLNRARESGRSAFCKNNLRQLTVGIMVYANDNDDYLPWPGRINRNKLPDWVFGGYQPVKPITPKEWKKADFALHAESGSVFSYVTGLPRVLPYSKDYTNSFAVYRCPGTGELGRARRVTYSMNACLDPDFPPVTTRGVQHNAIENPTQKLLLVDELPETSDDAGFEPASVGGNSQFTTHNQRVNVSFVDGHCETLRGKRVADIQSNKDNFLRTYFDPFYP
ncbi:MAG TPA: prepilin-type N-terminal cleavage/methylation domain-containing protein [Candidatus Paceibacterota bacterium]|nr:prepilin-type N-terminal cleavage/methylation domain-containing protein [Verrucomicrobiota bacterium]HRY50637.1 prepilin-type N-terminal cleavage/methylation domain-containing protein [Candidatus Paceibacterota bacterium]HSA02122.1 prepilin-type N-terminal cleavage/methylation domain-containing protein [Candidatus Paceibacterota bacterium]